MAKDKKSFLLYCDILPTFEELSDEEAGKLIKHILRYVNDKNPKTDDRIVKLLFEPIKQQLKRDLVKYENIRTRNAASARIRWDQKNASASERIQKDAKNADSDTDNDTVTDKVIDITNTLTDHEIGKTIEFCSITLRREYSGARVAELWKAFLINAQKKFHTRPEKIKHFRNWIKTQPDETHKRTNTGSTTAKPKGGTSSDRMEALKNW